jgi:hypothetical protein
MATTLRWAGRPETWVLAALLVLRVVLAADAGLGRDESAYWYWAHHGLDASYSLATVGAVRLATDLLGDSPLAARLPSLLAGMLAVLGMARTVQRLGGSGRAAVAAAIVLASVPTLSFSGAFVHTDTFLVLGVVWFGERAAAIAADGATRGRLLGLVLAMALAAYSKLTGALLAPAAAWILWQHRRAPGAVLAAAAMGLAGAGLVASADPRILAGIREFGRFAPTVPRGDRLLHFLGENLVWGGPALIAAAAAGALRLRAAEARARWPVSAAVVVWVAFFGAFALAGQAKANWLVPAMVLLVPSGVLAWEARRRPAWGTPLVGLAALITAGQAAAILLPGQPAIWETVREAGWARTVAPTYAAHAGEREQRVSPTRTWIERAEEFREPAATDPRLQAIPAPLVLASDDYGLAFRIAHDLGRDVRVLLPEDPMFARVSGGEPAPGTDVRYVSRLSGPPAAWGAAFEELRELPAPPGGFKDLRIWHGRNWRATASSPSNPEER